MDNKMYYINYTTGRIIPQVLSAKNKYGAIKGLNNASFYFIVNYYGTLLCVANNNTISACNFRERWDWNYARKVCAVLYQPYISTHRLVENGN